MEAPICPLCGIRPRTWDDEPGREPSYYESEASYSFACSTCCLLTGFGDHSHTHYNSPAQIAAGNGREGHSWRTSVLLRPVWENGSHVGYRCEEFDRCGWERRFTAEERQDCALHSRYPSLPVLKGVCVNHQEHRRERGECDVNGYLTEYGKAQERARSDAAVWDPGGYRKS